MRNAVRRHLVFHGTVQGVGFRYRARYICRSLDLTGWVRNRWDDSVEMEVQGRPEDIAEMERQLGRQHFIEITGLESTDIPVEDFESGFEIVG
ncbi:MAG: acylphosphatase [Lachnospiraceae bacterium]|jgi:acylphosphatase